LALRAQVLARYGEERYADFGPTLIGRTIGPGTLAELLARLARLGIQHPLVVTNALLLGTNSFRQLEPTLGTAEKGSRRFLYSGVHPNPIKQHIVDAAQASQTNTCDGVIAFGGGSPLDVAKAARLPVTRPGFRLAYFYSEPDWSGLVPLVAIPTTAGTGSGVGRCSVVTLAATGRKAVLFHPKLLAQQVILDPVLTRDLPPKLTAATGAHTLTHCIESYTCPVFHPTCDGIVQACATSYLRSLLLRPRSKRPPLGRPRLAAGKSCGGTQAVAFRIAFLTRAFTTSTLSRLRASGCVSRTARLAALSARASLGA
jgi:alcohol dehydrogenase class IV